MIEENTMLKAEIYDLKKQIESLKASIDEAKLMLVCIGGPLNDNVLQFNPKQIKFLHDLNNALYYCKEAAE